tara:strand:+ start:100 stop:279 length:180 start_codon:yes stop_codon:yes gene_type:complete
LSWAIEATESSSSALPTRGFNILLEVATAEAMAYLDDFPSTTELLFLPKATRWCLAANI